MVTSNIKIISPPAMSMLHAIAFIGIFICWILVLIMTGTHFLLRTPLISDLNTTLLMLFVLLLMAFLAFIQIGQYVTITEKRISYPSIINSPKKWISISDIKQYQLINDTSNKPISIALLLDSGKTISYVETHTPGIVIILEKKLLEYGVPYNRE